MTPALVDALAASLAVDPQALRAILTVESAGTGIVAGRPLIRLEVHLLWRAVAVEDRPQVDDRFRVGGPAPWERHAFRPSAAWVPLHQPGAAGQAIEWSALLLARGIDPTAADGSTSWGLVQILGSAWQDLVYPSLDAFVAAQADEAGQLDAFGRFLRAHGLVAPLNAHDWLTVARTYNGAGAAATYAADLAKAYAG